MIGVSDDGAVSKDAVIGADETSRAWYLYVIETARGALYTGITVDVERRLAQHRAGRGARALRGRGPLTLCHAECVGSHGDALRLEARIKRLRAEEKRRWLAGRAAGCHETVTPGPAPTA